LNKISFKIKILFYIVSIIISLKIFIFESKYNKKGIILKTIETISFFGTNNEYSFQKSLKLLGMNDYTGLDQLIASGNGKDFIIFSLESFEATFLTEKFSELTPFIQKLKNDWFYYNMNQNIGSNWTSGSLYTMFTGIPSFFATKHNSIFQSGYKKEIVGIPDIFKHVGFNLSFISKDAKFSGTRSMLGTFGFDKVIDGHELNNGFDKDIFDRVKSEITINKMKGKNFGIIISTLDTHGPNGIIDERFINKFNNLEGLEYSVAVLNYLIEDFYLYMEENNFIDNTTIIFLSDHLYMVQPEILKGINERNLIYLSNSKIKLKNFDLSSIYQVHMPQMILSSCGIEHNIKFFSDYFTNITDKKIIENQSLITSLNLSAFKLADYNYSKKNDTGQQFRMDSNLLIAHAGGEIDGYVYTNSLEALNESYEEGFRLFELDIKKTSDNKYVAVHDWDDWRDLVNYKNDLPPDYSTFMKNKISNIFTPMGIESINNWFGENTDAILITDKVSGPSEFIRKYKFTDRLIMELFNEDSILVATNLGIDVLLSENVLYGINYDINQIKKLNVNKIAVSHFFADQNIDFLQKLDKNGIITFVYGINDYFIGGTVIYNEKHFIMNNAYGFQIGLYADKYPL
jgi:lipoteichoic acid synthase